MDSDQPNHRPTSTPLFHAIPTGTYTYRYRDTRTDTRTEAPSSNIQSISQGKDKTREFRNEIETVEAAIQPPPSTTEGLQDGDEPLRVETQIADTNDPIHYRETVAVSNGSMTLLSKQVGVEAPQTGAKGRAREREDKKFAAARIMPSQGLVDAAKRMWRDEKIVSYPSLTAEGYLLGEALVETTGQREGRARRPHEMLLVGCGMDYDRRTGERGRSPPSLPLHPILSDGASSSRLTKIEKAFMVDGHWASGTEAQRFLSLHPTGESWYMKPGRENRHRERSRLLDENARLRKEVARLEEDAARRNQEEKLKDENLRLREKLRRLRGENRDDEEEVVMNGRSLFGEEELWKDAGLGNQPRRSANRGNRVGASLMSQEVMVEHPSAGKGRAREREEKRRLQNLVRGPSRSDSDTDEKEGRRRRTNWRTRVLTDSDDDTNEIHKDNDIGINSNDEDFRGRRAVALSNLAPDVIAKYGPDRPSRIWRDHSHEILVERNDGGGSKGRRREVNLKNEDGARLRFRPPRGLVDAAKGAAKGVNGDDDDGENGVGDMREEYNELIKCFCVTDGRNADSEDEEESSRGRSPDEALAKYAADRPPRMFRDGSCEVLVEGDVAGRRRRREGAFRRQLPEPRFMPSREMAEAAFKILSDLR